MKLVIYGAIAAVIIFIGLVTAPYWGGCGIAQQVCELSCEILHFNDGIQKTGCKTKCAAERLQCETE